MRESAVEAYLERQVKTSLGGLAWKFVSPGLRGVPDRLVLLPGGHAQFVELKAPGKEARAQQKKRHRELKALGFEVLVLDTKEKVDEYINLLKNESERNKGG